MASPLSSTPAMLCTAALAVTVACGARVTPREHASTVSFSSRASAVPSVAQLVPPAIREMPLADMPIVQNFWGAVYLRHDMLSLAAMTLTPYNGNMQNGSLSVDGVHASISTSQWAVCEGLRSGVAGTASITNAVRMPFEAPAVAQVWDVQFPDAGAHSVSMGQDGPFFRACDLDSQGACGWGTSFPVDRPSFAASVIPNATGSGVAFMLTVDGITGVAAASAVWSPTWNVTSAVSVVAGNSTFVLQFNVTTTTPGSGLLLQQAVFVGGNSSAAIAGLAALVNDFNAQWDGACTDWEARWQSAFIPPASRAGGFTGSLPILSSNTPAIDRLYYWSALGMISLLRTQYPGRPHVFVISQGPSNSLDGSAGMGGSGQFTWDLSFASGAMTLLDPVATRQVLAYIMASSDLHPPPGGDMPVHVPEYWDAYPEYGSFVTGSGSYRFDYYSAFLFLMNYVTLSNDSSLLVDGVPSLTHPGETVTGMEFLTAMATVWMQYNASLVSPFLVDYGPDKRAYLEVVSSYVDVVPALQAGNAGMSLALARLYEQMGVSNASIIAALRANASAIVSALVASQWNASDGGVWRCLYPNGTSAPVRTVTDFVYIAQALDYIGRNASVAIPADIAAASLAFFQRELLPAPTGNASQDGPSAWVRALSLADPLCADVMSANASVETLLACRADWGCFGSYGGIPGFAAESPVSLTSDFSGTIAALTQLGATAAVAAPGQGIAVGTPTYFAMYFNGDHAVDDTPIPPFVAGFPEFFDEPEFPPWWPDSLRYIQNAEASIVDVIIRTVFGWRPEWVTPPSAPAEDACSPCDALRSAAAAIDACIYLPSTSRAGFDASLDLLHTPLGYINMTASDAGVAWVWSAPALQRCADACAAA